MEPADSLEQPICDACKKNFANLFLTQIIEGKMQKTNLCEACSREKGITDPPTGFSLADFLHDLEAHRRK